MAKGVYTVGVRRKFLPFYKKYKVVNHVQNSFIMRQEFNDALNVQPRLFLYLQDGSEVCISRIEQRDWKIYPDYRQKVIRDEQKRLKKSEKAAKRAVPQRSLPAIEEATVEPQGS